MPKAETAVQGAVPTPAPVRLGAFLAAVSVSMLGDWLTTVAVVVALYEAAGAQGPAAYVLVRVGPRLLGSLGGGVADRWEPARSIAALSGLQAAVAIGLAASLARGLVAPALVGVAISQVLGAAQRPAHTALIPRLTTDARLPRANALYMAARSASLMVGPALAGPLLLVVSPSVLVGLDGLSFAVCAIVAVMLAAGARSGARRAPERTADRSGLVAATWADRTLRTLSLAYFASGLMMTCASASFADAASHELSRPSAAAWLYTVAGVGSIAGSGVALWTRPLRHLPTWVSLVAVAVLEWVSLAGFAVLRSAVVGLFSLAVCAAASSVWETWGSTEAQRRAVAGRVAGTMSVAVGATYSGMLAGALLAIVALPSLGWRGAVLSGAVAAAVVVSAGSLVPAAARPDVRRLAA